MKYIKNVLYKSFMIFILFIIVYSHLLKYNIFYFNLILYVKILVNIYLWKKRCRHFYTSINQKIDLMTKRSVICVIRLSNFLFGICTVSNYYGDCEERIQFTIKFIL